MTGKLPVLFLACLLATALPAIAAEDAEAIGKLWQSVIDSGAKDLQLEALEVGAGPDKMAYEVGRVMLTTPDGPAEGKYIVLWKQDDDGTWRLHRDIWNMNTQ